MKLNKITALFILIALTGCSSTTKARKDERAVVKQKNPVNVRKIMHAPINKSSYLVGVNSDKLHYVFKVKSKNLEIIRYPENFIEKMKESRFELILDNKKKVELLNLKIGTLAWKDGSKVRSEDYLAYYISHETPSLLKKYGQNVFIRTRYEFNKLYWHIWKKTKKKKKKILLYGIAFVREKYHIISFKIIPGKMKTDEIVNFMVNTSLSFFTVNKPITDEFFHDTVKAMAGQRSYLQ